MRVVADTSALVSLGVVADHDPSPLDCLFSEYAILTATEVTDELRDLASYWTNNSYIRRAREAFR